MLFLFGGSLSGPIAVARSFLGVALAIVSYCFFIRVTLWIRAVCVRAGFATVATRLADRAALRKTNTLDPPVMLLTATRSWELAAIGTSQNDAIRPAEITN